jgi:hypothetical protein
MDMGLEVLETVRDCGIGGSGGDVGLVYADSSGEIGGGISPSPVDAKGGLMCNGRCRVPL